MGLESRPLPRLLFKSLNDEFSYLLLRVIKVHCPFDLVVSSNFEGNDLQGDEARSHGEDLGPVSGLIQVLSGGGVGHTGRVPTHNVKVGTSHHSRAAMPLDLRMRPHGDGLRWSAAKLTRYRTHQLMQTGSDFTASYL